MAWPVKQISWRKKLSNFQQEIISICAQACFKLSIVKKLKKSNSFCLSIYLDHITMAPATNLGTFQMERGSTLSQALVPMAVQVAEFGSLFGLKSF